MSTWIIVVQKHFFSCKLCAFAIHAILLLVCVVNPRLCTIMCFNKVETCISIFLYMHVWYVNFCNAVHCSRHLCSWFIIISLLYSVLCLYNFYCHLICSIQVLGINLVVWQTGKWISLTGPALGNNISLSSGSFPVHIYVCWLKQLSGFDIVVKISKSSGKW